MQRAAWLNGRTFETGRVWRLMEAGPAAGQAGLGTGVEDKRQNDDNRDKIYNVAIAGVEAGQY